MKGLPAHKKESIDKLALAIFTKYQPQDPTTRRFGCHACGAAVKDYDARCAACGTNFPCCTFSGRAILDMAEASSCKACKRRFIKAEARNKKNCALCHTPLPNVDTVVIG